MPILADPLQPGVGDVVTIAHPGQLHPLAAAEFFLNGQKVGKDLTGMVQIGQTIDHRNRGVPCQFRDLIVGEGSDHDTVQIAGEQPSDIRHALPHPHAQVMVIQEQGQPTHLKHPDLKGDPRPAGRFLKDHSQRPPCQKTVRYATLEIIFEACGRLQQGLKFWPGDVV